MECVLVIKLDQLKASSIVLHKVNGFQSTVKNRRLHVFSAVILLNKIRFLNIFIGGPKCFECAASSIADCNQHATIRQCAGGESCLTKIWHQDKNLMIRKTCSSQCINKFISFEKCRLGKEPNCEICCTDDQCNNQPKENPAEEEDSNSLTYLDPAPPVCQDRQPIQISCVEVLHVVRSANGFIEPTLISLPAISDNSPNFRLEVNLPELGREPYNFDGTETEIRWVVRDKHNAKAICTTKIIFEGLTFFI